MATDTRTTEGYNLDGPKTRDNSKKLVRLNDDFGISTYGLSEIGHAGINSLKEEVSKTANQYVTTASIIDEGKRIFSKASSDWERGNPEIERRNKDVGFILAGCDNAENDFRVYHFQSQQFLPKKFEGGCLVAGKWHVARYFLNKLYSRDVTVSILKDLAVFLMTATMTVEKTVGGNIHLATVTRSESFKWVSEGEIALILEKNEMFSSFFEKQFSLLLLDLVNKH